jgi:hypothetical protein
VPEFHESQTKEPPRFEDNGSPNDIPRVEDLFSAPDLTQLLKPGTTKTAREYQTKTNSLLKALMVGAINVGDFPDAAAILTHGPGFAAASGQLADDSVYARETLDFLTAPSSPVVLFIMTGIPLIAQIFRNHEGELAQLPEARRQAKARKKMTAKEDKLREPRFKIRAFKREWPIYWNPRFKASKLFAPFKTQTVEPNALAYTVFSDPKVQEYLKKHGVILTNAPKA